jgi:hypothetical protein
MTVGNFTDGWAGKLDYLFRSRLIARLLKVPPQRCSSATPRPAASSTRRASTRRPARRCPPTGGRRWLAAGRHADPHAEGHDVGIVLHLRPEGYRPMPLKCGDDVYEAFLHVQQVAEFQRVLAKSVVGEALTLPQLTEERAA